MSLLEAKSIFHYPQQSTINSKQRNKKTKARQDIAPPVQPAVVLQQPRQQESVALIS